MEIAKVGRREYQKCYRNPQCREDHIQTFEDRRMANEEGEKVRQEAIAERNAYKELGISGTRWSTRQSNWRKAGMKHPPTAVEFVALHKQAGGYCAICGRHSGKRALHLHHDHKTGEWKGLVCGRCNMGMGQFEDDPELLIQAALWLKGEPHVLLRATPELDTTLDMLLNTLERLEESVA